MKARLDVLPKLMLRWRARDERLDRGTWLGVSEIAGRVQASKRATRARLAELSSAGVVERVEFSNGIFWRFAALRILGEGGK